MFTMADAYIHEKQVEYIQKVELPKAIRQQLLLNELALSRAAVEAAAPRRRFWTGPRAFVRLARGTTHGWFGAHGARNQAPRLAN